MTIAQIIKERRLALGLTQDEAARRAGVDRTSWARWEGRDPVIPSRLAIVAIARALKMRVEQIRQYGGVE